ncbi:MAG: hypothetical protein IJ327_04030, partial [Lachnospiraceae bacterium]|nr:hypothetical protein [Lachnospiraceae bacterium]
VVSGTKAHVRVLLEEGYDGTVHVRYVGMWYWKAAEIISLAMLLGCMVYFYALNKKRIKSD